LASIPIIHMDGQTVLHFKIIIFDVKQWVNGVMYCMVNGCTHVNGS